MGNEGTVLEIVHQAIAELNQMRPADRRLPLAKGTLLSGAGCDLDSTDLVNLVVHVEELLEERFAVFVDLADEKTVNVEPSPYRSVETLVQYVCAELDRMAG